MTRFLIDFPLYNSKLEIRFFNGEKTGNTPETNLQWLHFTNVAVHVNYFYLKSQFVNQKALLIESLKIYPM